jgi:hypothetical protein
VSINIMVAIAGTGLIDLCYIFVSGDNIIAAINNKEA